MRNFSKPVIFISLICIAGIILQYLLQANEMIGNFTGTAIGYMTIEQASVLFGLVVCGGFFSVHLPGRGLFINLNNWGFWLLVMLGLITITGTLIIPAPSKISVFTHIYHSFIFTGVTGLLAAAMLATVWKKLALISKLAVKDVVVLTSHIGILVIIAGAALTSCFSTEGILYMKEGETAASFEEVVHYFKTGNRLPLPQAVTLADFTVEYHEEKSYLRIYQGNSEDEYALLASHPAEEGAVFQFGKKKTDQVMVAGIYINENNIRIANLDITRNGQKWPVPLPAGGESALPLGNDLFITFEQTREPSMFRSILKTAGQTHEVLVNHPLSIGKYILYQSDYDPEDVTVSGFQVRHDPGRLVVIAGLFVLLSGVVIYLITFTILKP